jgi:hypothetical protein
MRRIFVNLPINDEKNLLISLTSNLNYTQTKKGLFRKVCGGKQSNTNINLKRGA